MGTQRAKYTVQKVVQFDAETAARIRVAAELEGVSESAIIRRWLAWGEPYYGGPASSEMLAAD